MKEVLYTILENRPIAREIWELKLAGDTGPVTAPGQFVNLRIDGCYLRRPLSVGAADRDRLTLIYKVVGHGTRLLSLMRPGETLNALAGLGNGFDVSATGARPLLIGGGVGVVPLWQLCRTLHGMGAKPMVVLGFNSAEDAFYRENFETLADTVLCTADGTLGRKGFVTEAIGDLHYTYFYACGPEPMFRALDKVLTGAGEYSFEARMGCGFGACMGCSCRTKYGFKRICKDGPVLKREEIIW